MADGGEGRWIEQLMRLNGAVERNTKDIEGRATHASVLQQNGELKADIVALNDTFQREFRSFDGLRRDVKALETDIESVKGSIADLKAAQDRSSMMDWLKFAVLFVGVLIAIVTNNWGFFAAFL
ncbi:MAG: hypothetical protein AAGK02_08045 [Pseudomonadota bacterium]